MRPAINAAAIRASGVSVVSLDDAGYRAGYAVAEDNLRLGHHVIDAATITTKQAAANVRVMALGS